MEIDYNEKSKLTGDARKGVRYTSYASTSDRNYEDEQQTTTQRLIEYVQKTFSSFFTDNWIENAKLVLIIVLLISATVTERVTFKMAADRLTPYRMVMEIFILAISLLIYSFITFLKRGLTDEITEQMREFSHEKLFKMSVLDNVQFSGLIISATGVSPTMTVILLHASTPCVVLGSRYLFPNRKYSDIQLRGVWYITAAILVSVSRPILWMFNKIDIMCTISSLVYVSSAAVQGLAILYKERCIIEWSRPMDIYFLSSWLFFYQLVVSVVFAPLTYMMQVVTYDSGLGFPLNAFPRNVYEGYKCILGHKLDLSHERYDTIDTVCDSYNLPLILLYVFSNVVILECVNRVLHINSRVLGRCMALSVLSSFIALGVYDTKMDYGYGLFGTTIGYADIVSIVILLVGMEIYGRDPEPDVEIITDYANVPTTSKTASPNNNTSEVDQI